MSNSKNEDAQNNGAEETPKKSSSRSRGRGRGSSGRSRSRGGRQTARAAEPEVLEPTNEEIDLDEVAEAAPATGAEAREEEEVEEKPAKSSRRRGGSRRGKKSEDEAVEASEQAPEDAPESKKKAASEPLEMSDGITPFAREFFLSRGILTAPTPRDEPEDEGEAITHDIPSKPKRRTPPSLMKQGRAWLDELFVAMEVEASSSSSYDKDSKTLSFDIKGVDAATLLGPNGASPRSLEAMEKVLSYFLDLEGSDYLIHIDLDGFRKRRGERLEELAGQLSELSLSLAKPITIAGMNEFERRVVHRSLSESEAVKTDSFGYGTFRKIRVEPS